MAVTDFPSSDVLYAVDDFGQRPIDLAKMAGSREFIREFELADAEVIRVIPDPLDNRTKLLELTPAGEHLVEFSKFILEGGASIEELLTGQQGVIDAMTKE